MTAEFSYGWIYPERNALERATDVIFNKYQSEFESCRGGDLEVSAGVFDKLVKATEVLDLLQDRRLNTFFSKMGQMPPDVRQFVREVLIQEGIWVEKAQN